MKNRGINVIKKCKIEILNSCIDIPKINEHRITKSLLNPCPFKCIKGFSF